MNGVTNNYYFRQEPVNHSPLSPMPSHCIGSAGNRDVLSQAQEVRADKTWHVQIKDFFIKLLKWCLPCWFGNKEDPRIGELRATANRANANLIDAQRAFARDASATALVNAVSSAQEAVDAATTRQRAAQTAVDNASPDPAANDAAANEAQETCNLRIDSIVAETGMTQAEEEVVAAEIGSYGEALGSFLQVLTAETPDQQTVETARGELRQAEQRIRAVPHGDAVLVAIQPMLTLVERVEEYQRIRAEAASARQALQEANVALVDARRDLEANPDAVRLRQAVTDAQQAAEQANIALNTALQEAQSQSRQRN